jgi:hypothetical protein
MSSLTRARTLQGLSLLLTGSLIVAVACSTANRSSPDFVSSTGPSRASQLPDDASGPGNGEWRTNFSKASVKRDEIVRAQIKDGIPAISAPELIRVSEVHFLADKEPVIAFAAGDDIRAYPLQILIWHEIVNDVVDGKPVLITFCPLCNTAIAFDRGVDGRALEFGVSGFLRNSDLVMFDRQTETWWQQITGEAIVGDLTGSRLDLLPSSIVSWLDFRTTFPEGRVLNRIEGRRPYGSNPYVGYDDISSSPFLYRGATDARLGPMERVATVEWAGETAAYPFSRLAKVRVVQETVGGRDIVVFFKRGTFSPLDKSAIVDSRDIGSATVFSPVIRERKLTFQAASDAFVDDQTGSRWDIFGRAVSGPLKGERLPLIVSGNDFWFALAAFKPDTRVWSSP